MTPMLRKALLIIGSVVGGFVLLVALLIIFANTGPGRRSIEWAVPKLTDGEVRLSGLSGRFPASLRVDALEVRDVKGPWLRADGVALDWSPLALVWNSVSVAKLTARRIDVARRPISQTKSESSDTHIRIGALAIEQLDLGAELAGRAARVKLSGKVDYRSLDEARIDVAAERLDAPGIYRVDVTIAGGAINGMVDVREPANGLIGGLSGLPQLGPLRVQGTASGPRTAQTIALTVRAGALHVDAAGSIDRDKQTLALDVQGGSPAMAPGPGIGWEAFSLNGRVRGSFRAPEIAARLSLLKLKAGGVATQTIAATIEGTGGRAQMVGEISGTVVEGLPPDLLTGPLRLRATVGFADPSLPVRFALTHKFGDVGGEATLGNGVKGKARLVLHSLVPVGKIAGVALQGDLSADATVESIGGKTAATLDAAIRVTGGDALVAGLIGRKATLVLSATQTKNDIEIQRARFDGAGLDAQARGALRDGWMDFEWTAALHDLSRIAATLSGELSLRGRATGPLDNFGVTATADGRIAGGKAAKGPIHLAVRLSGLPAAPVGKVSADGRLNGGALALLATLEQRKNGALSIHLEKGNWKSVRANATLDIVRGAAWPVGRAHLQATALGDLQPFIGTALSGSVVADVALSKGAAGSLARLTVNGKTIAAGGAAVDALALSGTVGEQKGRLQADLTLSANAIAAGDVQGSAEMRLVGPDTALVTTINSALRDAQGNEAQIHARAVVNGRAQEVLLDTLTTTYRGQTAQLAGPARIDLAGGVRVEHLNLVAAEARLSVAGRISPVLDVTASAGNVTAKLVRMFVPDFDGEGVLAAEARLGGTIAVPTGTLTLRGEGLRFRGSASSVPKGQMVARVILKGQSATVDAELHAGKTLSLSVVGDVPLHAGGAMDVAVKGNVDLALANPILNADGRNLKGTLALDARLSGTMALPRVEGTAVLANGDVQDFVQGVHVTALSGRIVASGNRISLSEFTGRAGKGTVAASGDIDVWAPGIPVNLAITAKNARLLSGNMMTVDADATLKLSGAAQSRVELAGTIRLDDGEVNLPETMPQSVAVLDVRRKGDVSAPSPARQGPVIGLNLTITSPGRLFVRGRGLEAEVSGRIRVAGDTARPDVSGGFTMRRGEFSLAGQTLNFTSGRLSFDGASGGGTLDPALNFTAESTSGSVTAKLEVTGYASAPRIKLSSSPYLPQDEVLAQLLFQQSVKQLGPLQLAQIAEGLGSLTGIGSGINPLSRVRKGLGLDRLAVGGGQNGTGATVEAGKYVMRGVYVGAKQDTGGGTTAQVQVDITRRLKAQATVNTGTSPDVTGSSAQVDRGSSIGLSYQFEY